MTKRLWQQRYKWTHERLAAAAPRDPAAARLAKPPHVTRVTYPFSRDEVLREHVRPKAHPRCCIWVTMGKRFAERQPA